jgi:hypothetical protein
MFRRLSLSSLLSSKTKRKENKVLDQNINVKPSKNGLKKKTLETKNAPQQQERK